MSAVTVYHFCTYKPFTKWFIVFCREFTANRLRKSRILQQGLGLQQGLKVKANLTKAYILANW